LGLELLTYVQPGDVVLHWHKDLVGESAVVGWSQATGVYEDTDIEWQARGTTGRASGSLQPRPAWRMPLMNFTLLQAPVTLTEVRESESQLRNIGAELELTHPGETLYFPFSFYSSKPLRAQQTYLVKMPREVLRILRLDYIDRSVGPVPESQNDTPSDRGKARKSAGTGYMADSTVRTAIEWHAVKLAIAAYREDGYEHRYVGNTAPYDLEVTRDDEVRRVEVKGSSGAVTEVELTIGEVLNSRDSVTTDLFVVDGITWSRTPDGQVLVDGGSIRQWRDWTADDSSLTAIRFRHTLPPGGVVNS
jgi:hypothetical protein